MHTPYVQDLCTSDLTLKVYYPYTHVSVMLMLSCILYLSLFMFYFCIRVFFFFFQAEDGIRDIGVTGVQTCALPICGRGGADHAVELPADDRLMEARAGAGRREHRRAQARGVHAADRDRVRADRAGDRKSVV